AGGHRRPQGVAERRAILRVDVLEPPAAELVGERAPGEVEPRLVDERAAAGGVGHPDEYGGGVGQPAKAVLALLQGVLGPDALGDVLGVAQHARRETRLLEEHVPVQPHALGAVLGDQPHEAGVDALSADAIEVLVELPLELVGQEPLQVPAHPVLGMEAQGEGGGGVDEEQVAVEVVDAHEAEAVLDEPAEEVRALLRALACGQELLELADPAAEELELLEEPTGKIRLAVHPNPLRRSVADAQTPRPWFAADDRGPSTLDQRRAGGKGPRLHGPKATRLRKAASSSTWPAPRTTHVSGSSLTTMGRSVSWLSRSSSPDR